MRKFVVIGMGSFGANIAKSLAGKGNEVIALDSDLKRLDDLKDYTVQTIVADATKSDVLDGIDIKDADGVIVSLGPNIEPSILTVHYLKKMKVKNITVKALSEDHAHILKIIGADRVVYPERDEAERIANILNSKNVVDYIQLSNSYNLFEVLCPVKYHGKSIRELDIRKKYNILIIGILDKLNENKFEMPDPDLVLGIQHTILMLGTEKDINKFSA